MNCSDDKWQLLFSYSATRRRQTCAVGMKAQSGKLTANCNVGQCQSHNIFSMTHAAGELFVAYIHIYILNTQKMFHSNSL